MRPIQRLSLAAFAATALFAALATTASARQFESSQQNTRIVFRPVRDISSSGDTISCTITLEGSFHYRTISKVAAALVGYITKAIVDTPSCVSSPTTGIRAAALTETLPWHITYVDFSGSLPNVTLRFKLNNVSFNISNVPIIGTCRYRASINGIVGGPLGGQITEGTRNATIRPESGIRARSETFGCPEAQFESEATPIVQLGTTTAITVRLI